MLFLSTLFLIASAQDAVAPEANNGAQVPPAQDAVIQVVVPALSTNSAVTAAVSSNGVHTSVGQILPMPSAVSVTPSSAAVMLPSLQLSPQAVNSPLPASQAPVNSTVARSNGFFLLQNLLGVGAPNPDSIDENRAVVVLGGSAGLASGAIGGEPLVAIPAVANPPEANAVSGSPASGDSPAGVVVPGNSPAEVVVPADSPAGAAANAPAVSQAGANAPVEGVVDPEAPNAVVDPAAGANGGALLSAHAGEGQSMNGPAVVAEENEDVQGRGAASPGAEEVVNAVNVANAGDDSDEDADGAFVEDEPSTSISVTAATAGIGLALGSSFMLYRRLHSRNQNEVASSFLSHRSVRPSVFGSQRPRHERYIGVRT